MGLFGSCRGRTLEGVDSWDMCSCADRDINWLELDVRKVQSISLASAGQLAILRYAIANGGDFHPDTCKDAANRGDFDTLKWARERGCSWGENVCQGATSSGHLNMLMWLREQGCPWDQSTLREAAEGNTSNHNNLLEWALLNGQWDVAALEEAGSRASSFGAYLWIKMSFHRSNNAKGR